MAEISGFPKNLSYTLKSLSGSIVRTKIRVQSDKSSYNANERIMFNFPMGRMIDTRSVAMNMKCTTNTNGNYFPRGASSLIESLQITANSRVLQSTQYYNYIWNALADVSGYYSIDQAPKRIYENYDPSVKHTNVQGEGTPAISNKALIINETESYYFTVNQWLGYFSSSAPCQDLNSLGQLQLVITLAPNSCLWLGHTGTTAATAGTYKVEEVSITMDCLTFTNSLYYDLVKSQLESNGLNICYSDYLVSVGSLVAKSTTGITHTAQFATSSLDMVMATFRPNAYDTPTQLYLHTAASASTKTYNEVISNPVTNAGTYGGFNQSKYFVRDGGGITESKWYLNSQVMSDNNSPVEIYNQTLCALDFGNTDIGAGGLHPGALTTGFYNKFYFVDILGIENNAQDHQNWRTGLNSNGSAIQVQYQAKFKTLTDNVYPVIIAKVSKVLNVKIGRNLDLSE